MDANIFWLCVIGIICVYKLGKHIIYRDGTA